MTNTLTPRELIDKAKSLIDEGFDKIGRSIHNPSLLDRYLIASTYKAIRFCDAIILLSANEFTDESLPILRSLIEHSINMRWIVNKNSEERLKDYMADLQGKSFGAPWTNINLYDRMKEIGFKDKDYFDFCVKVTYSYAHVNASSLKWGEVFTHPQLSTQGWSPDALLVVIAQMLGHIMKALDTQFVGKFNRYNEIWNEIKVDEDVRKKIESMKEKFENDKE